MVNGHIIKGRVQGALPTLLEPNPVTETQRSQIASIAEDAQTRIRAFLALTTSMTTQSEALDTIEEIHMDARDRLRDPYVGLFDDDHEAASVLYDDSFSREFDAEVLELVGKLP